MVSQVQSVIFDSKYYTVASARRWLRLHNFRHLDPDRKAHSIRFRQRTPNRQKRMRTIAITPTIDFVIMYD